MRTPRWILAGLVLVTASAAYSQSTVHQYVARTAAPAVRTGAVTAGNLTWQCAGSECRISGPWLAPAVGACAALAARVGRIVSYGRSGAMLMTVQLNQCNADLPATTQQIDPRAIQRAQMGSAVRAPSSLASASMPPASAVAGMSVRTATLTLTGVGALAERLPFSPIVVRANTLTLTGTGALAQRGAFSPVVVRTPTLTLTGE